MPTFPSSSPRSLQEQNNASLAKQAGEAVPSQVRIRYGLITDVDREDSTVKVRLYTVAGKPDIEIQVYNPIINPLSEIHLLWGKLRIGLACRFFFRGKEEPTETTTGLVEIIGDEGIGFLTKERKDNVLPTGPYKIFSGGLLG